MGEERKLTMYWDTFATRAEVCSDLGDLGVNTANYAIDSLNSVEWGCFHLGLIVSKMLCDREKKGRGNENENQDS